PVLEVKGVSKHFGGIRAVSGASLQIEAGHIHALIGPNGAGKTTLFNLISGLFPTDSGTISLNGREIQGVPSDLICHRGLARSFQITNLFRGLSIYENLRLSLQAQSAGRFNIWRDIDSYADIHAETAELTKFLGLQGIEDIEAGELSYGGQRLVDLGIALGSKPQVLLLDEPLAGLAAAERERVSNLIKNVAGNIPVLIVEHDIDRVLGFSHAVTVMNQGEVLMTGSPDAVRADRRVQQIYTGTGIPEIVHSRSDEAQQDSAQVLRFEAVNTFYGKSHILNDATLDVREGEIVALLGRTGAGYFAHGHRLRAAGARPVRGHDGAGKSRARPPGAQDRRQPWRGVERAADPRIFSAPERAHRRRCGLSVRRRAADGGGGPRDVGQRKIAAAGRAVRRPGADRDPGAVQGVRPAAPAHFHRDRRAQPRSGAGAGRPRVRAGARRGLPPGPRRATIDRSRIPQENPVALIRSE